MARPTPVFPEVGSTIVPPGLSFPSCSARSIIGSPIRSLTEPPGFRCSSFASSAGSTSRPSLSSRTIGVEPRLAGLASGLLNTNQQIGGAVGVAVVTTIFTSATSGKHPHSKAEALALLTKGFQHGFWALVALSVAGAIAGFVLLRGVKAEDVTEHEAAGVAI